MPWLVGTALIHSLAVTEKRGLFKSWTLLLAILAFSLSLLGTFLVRSGVLVSVHSFAADPTRGMFILAFLVIVIGGALTLYAWRAPLLRSEAGFEFTARESFLLFNNILLVVAAGAVFAGTMAPLISDALGLGTLSVGRQYFDPVFLLPTLPLLALAAVGIHSSWKKGRLGERRKAILLTLVVGVLVAVVLVLGAWQGAMLLTPIGFALGVWLVLSALVDPLDRWRRGLSLGRSVVGMAIAHAALGLFVISITAVESYTRERDLALAEEPLGVGGLREVDRDDVGLHEERLERRHELDAELSAALLRHVGVERDDLHAEGRGALGDEDADASETDDAEHLAEELGPLEPGPLPSTGAQGCVRQGDVARLREQERHRVLGRGDDVGLGRVHDEDAARGRGRDVDVVEPDACARDDLESVRSGDDLGGDARRRPDDEGLVVADGAGEVARGEVGTEVDVEVGAEQVEAVLGEFLGDEDPHRQLRNAVSAAATAAPGFTGTPMSASVISSAARPRRMSRWS